MASRILAGLVLACGLVSPARGVMQCTLTAVPLQVSVEGLAEPIGDIVLHCGGGTPGATISGSWLVSLDARVANRIQDGNLQGVVLSQTIGGVQVPLTATAHLIENVVSIEQVLVSLDGFGGFEITISGIRAETSSVTKATLLFSGNEQLLVSNPVVTVAFPLPALFASNLATIALQSPPLPDPLSFSAMMAAGIPLATTRVTEGWGATFVPRTTIATGSGTRILIRILDVRTGGRVFGPDAIAGSSALVPTSSGQMSGGAAGGMYGSAGGHSLSLSRVRGASIDGSGGNIVFAPPSLPQTLDAVGEAEYAMGAPYLVYEVMDAHAGIQENAQIPIWVWLPPEWRGDPTVAHQEVNIAPVSDVHGVSATAPIPRFLKTASGPDCDILNDCSAAYFPKMSVKPADSTDFTAPAGTGLLAGTVGISQIGTGLMFWRVTVSYKNGANWIIPAPDSGYQAGNMRYFVSPKGLTAGHYEASLIFDQLYPPNNKPNQQVIGVTLQVTAPIPPLAPAPVISDIVSPAVGYGQPAAPGALVVIRGANFQPESTVTIAGQPALVVQSAPSEMTVQLPLTAPTSGWPPVFVYTGTLHSAVWGLEMRPVWPGTLGFFNGNGEMNNADHPVTAGDSLLVQVTGIKLAETPVTVQIHDRFLQLTPEASSQPGIDMLRIVVPVDLPTMQSALMVCAKPASGGDQVCSYPKDYWMLAKPSGQ